MGLRLAMSGDLRLTFDGPPFNAGSCEKFTAVLPLIRRSASMLGLSERKTIRDAIADDDNPVSGSQFSDVASTL